MFPAVGSIVALTDGLGKLKKYYFRLDEKPSFVLALGKLSKWFLQHIYFYWLFTVLHPYYKLAYIKLAWGGEVEQAAEIAAGNPHAKNWQAEAKKIVQKTVRLIIFQLQYGAQYYD